MPRFSYRARNSRGDLIHGDVDARDYTAAVKRISASNLFIVDLAETEYDEPKLKKKETIHHPVHPSSAPPRGASEGLRDDSPIVFLTDFPEKTASQKGSGHATVAKHHSGVKTDIQRDELQELCERTAKLLEEKRDHLSRETREELALQANKVGFVRESGNAKLLKKQRKVLQKLLKQAGKEINRYEMELWEKWGRNLHERKNPSRFRLGSLLGIEEDHHEVEEGTMEVQEKRVFHEGHPSSPIQQIVYWYRVLNHPDESKQEEVVMREKYDAVWTELQRFIGVLLFFYLIFYFVAYSYLQTGVGDSFILRVYDTPLFKQIVVVMFFTFGVLTLRKNYMARRLWFDGMMFLAWMGVMWTLVG